MTYGAQTPGGSGQEYCYRHPDRPTGVHCQRCGRPLCTHCQILAPVGVQCSECARAGGAERRRPRRRLPAFLRRPGAPLVTYALIAACVLLWLLQLVIPGLTSYVTFFAPLTHAQPWRILTAGFAHSTTNLLHLPLNMYTLWLFGMILEPMLGRARFLVVYVVTMLGGWAAVALLAPTGSVLGASGALFGLMAVLLLLVRHGGGQYTQLLVLLGVNLVFGFLGSGVSWQAHVGGLVFGLAAGELLVLLRRRVVWQWVALAGLGVVALALVWGLTDPVALFSRL